MIFVIIVLISSTIGLVGFFINNPIMFYVGGTISLLDMIRYLIIKTINKDKMEIENIKRFGFYQRSKNSAMYHAKNRKELDRLIKQFIFGNVVGRVISYSIIIGLIYWIFSWEGFIWIGIVGGFGYIYILIMLLRGKKNIYNF